MSRPQPVLLVSNHGDIVGGGEVSLLALVQALDRSRWSPLLVIPSEGAVGAEARALGIPSRVIPLPPLRRPAPAMVSSALALHRLAREAGARLLHANGSRAMLYAGLGGWFAGRPVIWHVRVAERDSLLDRLLVPLARRIIVNSNAVADRFRWVPPGKVRCIHNGVDLSRFAPRPPCQELRAALGLPGGVPVVGSVGRFVPYKGYAPLLEAARLVGKTMPEVHWVLVGDGELRSELEARRRDLGMETRVHFPGWRRDVPDILALCDVFVLPSLLEHFGRVVIEAMAMAVPVVATEAGGVPEIVIHGETGLLVPPGRPEALADAVLALLREPARARRLGGAGRRRAETAFGLARHAEAVEALYREVLGAKDGGV